MHSVPFLPRNRSKRHHEQEGWDAEWPVRLLPTMATSFLVFTLVNVFHELFQAVKYSLNIKQLLNYNRTR